MATEGPRVCAIETVGWEQVKIEKADNGFIVRVGCKVFVFSTWLQTSDAIASYWENPVKAEKKYCK